jgi:hypothetical protein
LISSLLPTSVKLMFYKVLQCTTLFLGRLHRCTLYSLPKCNLVWNLHFWQNVVIFIKNPYFAKNIYMKIPGCLTFLLGWWPLLSYIKTIKCNWENSYCYIVCEMSKKWASKFEIENLICRILSVLLQKLWQLPCVRNK